MKNEDSKIREDFLWDLVVNYWWLRSPGNNSNNASNVNNNGYVNRNGNNVNNNNKAVRPDLHEKIARNALLRKRHPRTNAKEPDSIPYMGKYMPPVNQTRFSFLIFWSCQKLHLF